MVMKVRGLAMHKSQTSLPLARDHCWQAHCYKPYVFLAFPSPIAICSPTHLNSRHERILRSRRSILINAAAFPALFHHRNVLVRSSGTTTYVSACPWFSVDSAVLSNVGYGLILIVRSLLNSISRNCLFGSWNVASLHTQRYLAIYGSSTIQRRCHWWD